jgi:hypothetical protein
MITPANICDYEQLCNSCGGDRYLELMHHGRCDRCDKVDLVGMTHRMAVSILLATYD